MNKQAGFTLAEVMMTVAVLVIFASFTWVSLSESAEKSRDAERQADLRSLQAAVELYRQKNGSYPDGCMVASWTGNWSGQVGTDYNCPGGSAEYIIDLAPEFIPVLPTDPKLNGTNSGYVYTTNPQGTVYKIMALNTVESETVTYDHPLVRCGNMTVGRYENLCVNVPSLPSGGGTGYEIDSSGGGTPGACTNAGDYNNDYAVAGGFALGGGAPYRDLPKAREYYTDRIRCK